MSCVQPERYLIVVNPRAGKGRAGAAWEALSRELARSGLPHDVLFSEPDSLPGTLAHIRTLPESVAIVAVGGDGTVRSLLPALVGTGRSLGVIPLGRGNDLAAALGWRAGDLGRAVARLSQPVGALDVLRVRVSDETHYSLNGVGMGFDAQVTARAAGMPRVLGGFGQYACGALASVAGLRSVGLEVTADGETVFCGESFLSAVMNGSQYGGGFRISPRSRVDDGLANVLVGQRVSRLALLPLMARVLRGRHLGHSRVVHVQARYVTLCWAEPMPLHLDGDLVPAVERLEVEVLPGALRLLGACSTGTNQIQK